MQSSFPDKLGQPKAKRPRYSHVHEQCTEERGEYLYVLRASLGHVICTKDYMLV